MNIAVYCGSASGNRPSFTEGAKALGSWIAQNGHTLVYGGSRTGLMKKIFEEMVEVGFSEKEDFKRVLVSADLDEIERFIEQ